MKYNYRFIFVVLLLCPLSLWAQNIYFVSTSGSDSNIGTTIDKPFATLVKAASAAAAGDTIYIRGGTYNVSSTISLGSSTKSGTYGKQYYVFAYKGERPVFNFSTQTSSDGIKVNGNYWYLKGIESCYAYHNGIAVNGSYNTIENCSVHDNKNTGMQFSNGASYNRIINCDSYYNYDSPSGGNADGFSPKLDTGTWNYFYGCRAWQNSDDGWDGYLRPADNVTTVIENCWSFMNGYLKNGTQITTGNGNGFKMGGGDSSNKDSLRHNMILKNCLCFDNRVKGYDQNNNRGSMTILNCTGFRNGSFNFSIPGNIRSTSTATIKNCISFPTQSYSLISRTVQEANTWLSSFSVSSDDFVSIDTTGVRGPRKADGSLPDITFMHLKSTSGLIDKGVNVGIQFTGSSPDLGAFEYGMKQPTDVAERNILPSEFYLEQNYPNPFNPSTIISYRLPAAGHVSLKVYDVLGREVATLVNEFQNTGTYNSQFSISNMPAGKYGSQLPSGIYFYQLKTENFVQTKKMMLLK